MSEWSNYSLQAGDARQLPPSVAPKSSRPHADGGKRPPSQMFAGGLPGGVRAVPLRPSRSDKRISPPVPVVSNNLNGNRAQQTQRQRMPNLVQALKQQPRPASALSFASISSEGDHNELLNEYDQEEARQSPVEEPRRQAPTQTMASVLSAFSDAGQRSKTHGSQSNSTNSAAHSPISPFNSRLQNTNGTPRLENDDVNGFLPPVVAPLKTRVRRGGVGEQGESSRVKKSQSSYPSTPAFMEIERVLNVISQDWPMLIIEGEDEDSPITKRTTTDGDGFNPVPLALALLGDPDRPNENQHHVASFLRVKDDLERALKSHIQLHYRAFDASVSAYNSTLVNMTSAQKEVIKLRTLLGDVKDVLGAKRTELANMVARRDELSEMSRILDVVDSLKDVPDTLESLLSEKRFLSAVVLLVRSNKRIRKPEIAEIGALADLKAYLQAQESSIYDIIVEEVHNHLYLKSFYCESRWRAYSVGQTTLPVIDVQMDDTQILAASRLSTALPTTRRQSRLQQYLHQLASRPSVDPLIGEPENSRGDFTSTFLTGGAGMTRTQSTNSMRASVNNAASTKISPELDSFTYIESLFEALACLGKLGDAFELIGQRVPTEIFNLVDNTVEEVEERGPKKRQSIVSSANNASPRPDSIVSISNLTQKSRNGLSSSLNTDDKTSKSTQANLEVLRDLFWTLFSKLDAVLQGFRVAYEVSLRIGERRSFKSQSGESTADLIFSLVEIWKPVQSEVKALLHEYLAENDSAKVTLRSPATSVNEILRLGRSARDHSKPVFKFGETENKNAQKLLKVYEDDLTRSLKASVPGLVTTAAEGQTTINAAAATEDRFTDGPEKSRGIHRLLASPDPFNVPVLFVPTLAFLDRVQENLPNGLIGDEERGASAFLDDFVSMTYLPMLRDKVSFECNETLTASDAFQEDSRWRRVSHAPVVKSAINLSKMLDGLCAMLQSSPFHQESYSQLITDVIDNFLHRCTDKFKDLTTREQQYNPATASPALASSDMTKRAAVSAQSAKMVALFRRIQANLVRNELTEGELKSSQPTDDPSQPSEELYEEMRLNFEAEASSPADEEELILYPKRLQSLGHLYSSLDWFKETINRMKIVASTQIRGSEPQQVDRLDDSSASQPPVRPELTARFDALLTSFDNLANLLLLTIRCELRLRVIVRINKMIQQASYDLSEISNDPDDAISALNAELSDADSNLASALSPASRNLVLVGLPTLADQLFISIARRMRAVSNFGADKMCRNVVALQQSLKNLGEIPLHVNLERSRRYYDLMRSGQPNALIEYAQSTRPSPFSFEECKVALSLICEVSRDGTSITSPTGIDNRRQYNEYLIELMSFLEEED